MQDGQPRRTLLLKNRKGESLIVTLCPCRSGDEEGMIACIRDEYGDTYFKRSFYSPAFLAQEIRKGIMTFLVAEREEKGIIGMLLLKDFHPEESMCEIASQIFRKEYRGYGLAEPFFSFGMDILKTRSYSAAYSLPALFHDVTQRLLYRQGLRATGFFLNVFCLSRIIHSYENGRNVKHSQGVQVMAMGKRTAGELYLPEEHREFCGHIYRTLGVTYQIGELRPRPRKQGNITWMQNREQLSLEIRIHEVGRNLRQGMAFLESCFPPVGCQTINVCLNINDPNAQNAYVVLKEMGYFFTGLKPLCSDREYMILHKAGDVEIFFEDYVLTGGFRELADYVGKSKKNQEVSSMLWAY